MNRCRLLLILLAILCAHGAAAQKPAPRLLVCYGDSITAGFGLEPGQSYPSYLQQDLDKAGRHVQVVNRGTSGATTKDAVAGLRALLDLHPAYVIVEFGGNDGLRGLPLAQTRRNLDQVLSALRDAKIPFLLAGITLPPNYGPEYIRQFEAVYRDLAAHYHCAFVPMLYADLIHVAGTIQPDGIHPTAKGAAIVAHTLERQLPAVP